MQDTLRCKVLHYKVNCRPSLESDVHSAGLFVASPSKGCFGRITHYPELDRATTGQILPDGVVFSFVISGRLVGNPEVVSK